MTSLLRTGGAKRLRTLRSLVSAINAVESSLVLQADEALRSRTSGFRAALDRAGTETADVDDALAGVLVEAFALAREAARRSIGQRPFDVQLMGGAAQYLGWVAEMRTGEGKTLAAVLPAYLQALAGRGVHVVTVNDYLAERDAESVGQVLRWLGLTVGRVSPTIVGAGAKRDAYACDVTYGTPTELGFDYLRDNMAPSAGAQVQRGQELALVDEVDSVLVDEARTPLVISGRAAGADPLYDVFAALVAPLQPGVHYDIDDESRSAWPTEEGIAVVEAGLDVENIYAGPAAGYPHHLRAALRAKAIYQRDRDYVVLDGAVLVVDEATGRLLAGRRLSEGLHSAIEAKEGVAVLPEDRTMATITLQSYFRLYRKLAGMTGTAMAEADELERVYGLQVVEIPTNRPVVRRDHPDLVYRRQADKVAAVVDDVVERHRAGQPVLVGTVSVEQSEHLAKVLSGKGVRCRVLNAKQHHDEALVVAEAGRLGAVTVATNMAGRGTDIILGGTPGIAGGRTSNPADCAQEAERVRALGGLYVLGTERHSSRRIDDQLRGRSGRQGDPGESRFYLSLEDDLMRLFAGGAASWLMAQALPEGVPLAGRAVGRAVERAQGLVEARDAQLRRRLLDYDEALDSQRQVLYRLRQQVLDAADPREAAAAALGRVLYRAAAQFCPEGASADIDGLVEWVAAEFRVDVVRSGLETSTEHDEIVATILEAFPIAGILSDPAAARARSAMVSGLDRHWRDLLREAECLREGIELRRMGQLDPLHEWTRETYLAFSVMMESADRDLARQLSASAGGTVERAAPTSAAAIVPEGCWCGSGSAYETCHGRPGRSRPSAAITG